jgi:hypothetical protein
LVDKVWKIDPYGHPVCQLCTKLKRLKKELKKLNSEWFSDISNKVAHTKEKI